MTEHVKFPKIKRSDGELECYVTEKIDGTNAQIFIGDFGAIKAGSRNRWITPDADNMGFAQWVEDNKWELLEKLPPGRHYGEWWGQGIQRGYGLSSKCFSPFHPLIYERLKHMPDVKMIPRLYRGTFTSETIPTYMGVLALCGSLAVPGWGRPEGIVVYFPDFDSYLKQTFDGPKWKGLLR